jgi:hypothetical protein
MQEMATNLFGDNRQIVLSAKSNIDLVKSLTKNTFASIQKYPFLSVFAG